MKEWSITIPVPNQKLVVSTGDSVMEVDLGRFYFGDGEALCAISRRIGAAKPTRKL